MIRFVRRCAPGAALVALAFVAYVPCLRAGFIWDDDTYVTRNFLLTSLAGLRRIWVPLETIQYYPLVFSSFWMEHALWGFEPLGYHITNIALHAGNALLVFWLLRALQIPGALLAAAIFAVHPVHVESVAWVTERKNVLSGFFYLASLLSYLHFTRDRSTRWYVLAFGLFLCALLSKTVTSSLPVVLLLLWWMEKRQIGRADIARLLPFFIAGVAMGLLTAWIERVHVGARGAEWELSIAQRVLIAGRALWFYVGKLVWPSPLTFVYPRWEVDASDARQWIWPVAVMAVAAAAWLYRSRWGRAIFASGAIFAVTLAPALGFVNTYPMRYSFVADHFQYLASIAIIALCAAALSTAADHLLSRIACGNAQKRWIAIGATIPLLVTLVLLTWRQGLVYENPETLWTDTLNKNPAAWMAHNNLGNAWYEQGRLEEARAAYQAALQLKSDLPDAHGNLGNIWYATGHLDEAVAAFQAALRLKPGLATAHDGLGIVYSDQGRTEAAIEEHRRALEVEPHNPMFLYNLGNAYTKAGMLDDAEDAYLRTARLSISATVPHHVQWIAYSNVGRILYAKGRLKEALTAYQAALRMKPGLAAAHSNIANIYSDQGRTAAAIEEHRRALQLEPNNAEILYNLGNTYMRSGLLDDAVKMYAEAVRQNPTLGAAHYNLAVAYYSKHEYARAIYHCDRAIELAYPVPAQLLELLKPHRR